MRGLPLRGYFPPVPSRAMSTASQVALADATRALAHRRWKVAAALTALMVVVYFGFITLVAFQPLMLAQLLHDGLSLGILLGALVIVSAWLLTFAYVSWANRVYDPALARLRAQHAADADGRSDAASDAGARST